MSIDRRITIQEVEQLTDIVALHYKLEQDKAADLLNQADVSVFRAAVESVGECDLFTINPVDKMEEIITVRKNSEHVMELIFSE